MARKNSCFISFRHGKQELTKSFISQFYEGLSAELEAQLGRNVGAFLDEERLNGGDLFNEALAKELCESSCLVMIYTPPYFDDIHTYCAREYQGMVALEQERHALLEDHAEKAHGLIIPVIFRGGHKMPPEIRDHRHCYDFSDFLLAQRSLSKHPKYAGKIQQMAEYIAERHRRVPAVPGRDCNQFHLPTEAEIRPWLRTVLPAALPLPGRADD